MRWWWLIVLAACGPSGGPGHGGANACPGYCDPVQGLSCDIDSGRCVGACAPANLGESYIGCDYYPTITGNTVNSRFAFAVVVSNTSSETATVTVEWGTLDEALVFDVPPGDVAVRELPWSLLLKGCETEVGIECSGIRRPESSWVPKGAFHLRSTQPVTVYQFNPLDYALADGTFSYTNDASLLLPANALTGNYVVAAWPDDTSNGGHTPGFMAVTATADDTSVTIRTRTGTEAGDGAPAFEPGVPGTVVLHQGDVLELFAWGGDLTGSTVTADKPVEVIAGHFCTFLPLGIGYCDHLEEAMFPVETLGARYAVGSPAIPAMPDGKVEYVRIVAAEPQTTVMGTTLAEVGDFLEIPGDAGSFVVHADKKVLVAQYMEGQEAGGGTGDPAMALAVPVAQYRTQYLFHAPVNYETNYLNVMAPDGASIELDGQPIVGFQPLGADGLSLKRVVLDPLGNHTITGDVPFGISVYGYGQYTSYWYPGGLDLSLIVVDD